MYGIEVGRDYKNIERRLIKMYEFEPKNICAKKITFEISDDKKLHNVNFVGGCPGNLGAIVKLLEGADAGNTVKLLRGNLCGSKNTSCADQLAIAIEKALAS